MGYRIMQKIIAFDLDGVIAKYDGWRGEDYFGEPNTDIIQTMKRLKDEGYRIIIWTVRKNLTNITNWLLTNSVTYDDINYGTTDKPLYHILVDDRAINYWGQTGFALQCNIDYILDRQKKEKDIDQ